MASRQKGRQDGYRALLVSMESWPDSWKGDDKDLAIGKAIVKVFRPFVVQLHQQGLSSVTIRRHVDNLWLIGGEIIRELYQTPSRRRLSAHRLVFEAVQYGEAPLSPHANETLQRSLDSTARKFLKMLSAQTDTF